MQKYHFTLILYLCFAAFSWKCKRVGHLPEDCTVKTGNYAIGTLYINYL